MPTEAETRGFPGAEIEPTLAPCSGSANGLSWQTGTEARQSESSIENTEVKLSEWLALSAAAEIDRLFP